MRLLEVADEPPVGLALVEREVGVVERGLLLASDLPRDQIGDAGQPERLVERDEVRLDLAGPHEVDPREEHAVDVEERLHAPGPLLLEKPPLRLREAEVMVRVVASDAAPAELLELVVLGRVWTTSGESSCSST